MRKPLPSAALCGVLLSLATAASAAPNKEQQARELAEQAMQGDYLATRFQQAERKLQKALKLCGKKHCSPQVQAELHRDLGVVYLAGSKKPDKGKKELRAAVAADPQVRLDPDFSTPEVEKAFVAAGGVVEKQKEPEPEAPEPEVAEPETPPAEPAPADGAVRNWFSLSFQQELLVYGATSGVCSGAEQYHCFLSGEPYAGSIYDAAGNEIHGGVGGATRRVLIGYERVLGDEFTLGGKLGFAFAGSPEPTGAKGLVPFHAELRGSYWFGEAPFASGGLRSYVGLAAGLGEVDGRVTVEYYVDQAGYQSNQKGKLDAWRQTGPGFVGLHAGLALAPSQHHALSLELRLLQILPASAFGGALNVGYSFGL
jgi:hypothetical protein